MIARAWYVRCDGPCGGNPAEVSTSSAADARELATTRGWRITDQEPFVRVRVDGRLVDLCPMCQPEVRP